MMTALSREHTRQARQRSSSGRWEATCSSSASSKSAKLAMTSVLEREWGGEQVLVERGAGGGSSDAAAQVAASSPAARTWRSRSLYSSHGPRSRCVCGPLCAAWPPLGPAGAPQRLSPLPSASYRVTLLCKVLNVPQRHPGRDLSPLPPACHPAALG